MLSLFIASPAILLVFGTIQDLSLSGQVAAIHDAEKAGTPLSNDQQEVLRKWKIRIDKRTMTPAKVQAEIAEETSGYLPNVIVRTVDLYRTGFATNHIYYIPDCLSAMLIGMGLMKMGFFTAELSSAVYLWTAIVGFGISLPLYGVGILKAYESNFFRRSREMALFALLHRT